MLSKQFEVKVTDLDPDNVKLLLLNSQIVQWQLHNPNEFHLGWV
ncbi:MAG: hypothetical protein ACUVWO_13830 [Thermodesulfobacteriota bacterium]